MRYHFTAPALLVLIGPLATGCQAQTGIPLERRKVEKTDSEWAKILTRSQFLVCRRKVTEPAFSGKLVYNHAKGFYTCVCCDAALFTSGTKFESGTGWPSFWRPVTANAVGTASDFSDGDQRVEVMCRDCGSHLGHVFNDGPPPTGLRYCINSVSLRFVKAKSTPPKSKAKAKSTAKPKESEPPPKEKAPATESEGKAAESPK